jgi:Subtilisin inhibitor-like
LALDHDDRAARCRPVGVERHARRNHSTIVGVEGVVKWLLVIVPLVVVVGCAGGHHGAASKTRLNLVVTAGGGHALRRYTLDCRPTGGSAPNAGEACRALEDFLPRVEHSHAACACALYVKRISVSGILDGAKLSRPLEVSTCAACGLGPQAQTDLTQAFAAFGMHA